MATGVACPPIILQFFNNAGEPNAGGYITTKVGAVNHATYEDVGLLTPLPNPIPLNSRGEVSNAAGASKQLFLDPNVVYVFTMFDINGNQLNQASTVEGLQLTGEQIADLLSPVVDTPILYSLKRTAAEIAAGVTPTNYAYAPGTRARYATLAGCIAVSASHPSLLYDDETITAEITVPTGAQIYGVGRPQITNSVAGARIFVGSSLANVVIDGIRFKGADSSTAPSGTVGGYAATSTGLVTIVSSSDIRVTNCEADTFYNGFTFLNCERLWVEDNYITHWLVYGILASECSAFTIDDNRAIECDQTGGADAYGVMATGDDAAVRPVKGSSISFNDIWDVPSWDGIMSHSCSGLRVIGNDIRNVRNGIDISAPTDAQVIRDLLVANNYVESTDTNTWGATPAAHFGIKVVGFDATHQATDAVISDNIIRNFYTTAGMVGSGDISNIVAEFAARTAITGNVVTGAGSVISNAGIFVVGNCPGITVVGNVLEGTMASGGIRLLDVVADVAAITGNTIKQASTANLGVWVSGSTIPALSSIGNATNCDAGSEFVVSTSTVGIVAVDFYKGSATYDPGNISNGDGVTTTVTVTGAAVGNFADVSFSNDLQGITVTAWVSAANTVSVRFQNETGGALDLASGTLRARVWAT